MIDRNEHEVPLACRQPSVAEIGTHIDAALRALHDDERVIEGTKLENYLVAWVMAALNGRADPAVILVTVRQKLG
jgi:hypothetical protein